MNRQQSEILARAIEGEAADAARLSNIKSGLAMKAQALISKLNMGPARTVGFALEFSEQAEVAVHEWAERRFKTKLTAGATADVLEVKGSDIIEDFVAQLEQARDAAITRRKESKMGIVRK